MRLTYTVRLVFFVCICFFSVKEHASTKSLNGSVIAPLKQLDEKDQLRLEPRNDVDENNAGEPSSIIGVLEKGTTKNGNESTSCECPLQCSNRKSMKLREKRRRQRKNLSNRKSCPTQTTVSMKKTAQDIFGMTVDVHPFIIVGNLAMEQIFYETFCKVENCKCAGLSKRYSASRCHTTYTNVYARIIKSGKDGWGLIKVRSGCMCVLQ